MPLYDYTAAKRAKVLSEKVSKGMMKKFIMMASLDFLAFEAAEDLHCGD